MSLKVWHSLLGTAVAMAFGVIFFTDAWNWLFVLLAVWLTAFFASNLVFASLNRARLKERHLWNVSEYGGHQDFSLAAAKDVWNEERPDSRLELRVKLTGRIRAIETKRAPLSAQDAAAWRVTADGFRRTRLGAEGDFTPLVDKTWVPRLMLTDADGEAVIEPPARLNAGCYREELVTWDGLDRFPAMKTLVHEALTLQGLKKDQFTGVRLTETKLEPEPVTVYGRLRRGEGFRLSGNDVADDADSLLIVADRARDKLRLKPRRSAAYWVNAGLLALSLPVSAVAILGSPLFPKLSGPVKLTTGARDVQIELGDEVPHIWTFAEGDTRTLVALQVESEDYVAAGAETLTVRAYAGETVQYGPGSTGLVQWSEGHWLIDPERPAEERSGLLRFRNTTSRNVTLRFPGSEFSGYTWNLGPREGANTEDGNYLTLRDEDLAVAEGTEVSLTAGKSERHLVAGTSPELEWVPALNAWKLQITAAVLRTHAEPLWAVPHPTRRLRGTAELDGVSKTFDVAPDPSRKPAPVKSVAGDALAIIDAQRFTLKVAEASVVYTGPLQAYRGARWKANHWEVSVPAP